MSPTVLAAIIGLSTAVIVLIVRDVVMVSLLARRKRLDEEQIRLEERTRARRDAVRTYGDPLYEAVRALGFRLKEIVDEGPAHYLLAGAAPTRYVEYKRISTFYRLVAVLGWIRAIRRERSYLDPEANVPTIDSIAKIEAALAEGTARRRRV